jgi:hypothetical protein
LVSPEREFLELAEPTKGYGSSSTTAELKKEYSWPELPDYFLNLFNELETDYLALTLGWWYYFIVRLCFFSKEGLWHPFLTR